jgi:hypothetical protein
MSKFKVGDKVKIISLPDNYVPSYMLNKVVDINADEPYNHSDGYRYEILGINDSSIYWVFKVENLELVNRDFPIETLIKRANMGYRAIDQLNENHAGKFHYDENTQIFGLNEA